MRRNVRNVSIQSIMMTTQHGKYAKLQEFSKKVQEAENPTDFPAEDAAYEVRLRNTAQHLQDQLKREEVSLRELRLKSSISSFDQPSEDPKVRLHQLRIITKAYQSLTDAEPVLPSADSPIPALLTLRSTHDLINETKTLISTTCSKLTDARTQLGRETHDLADAAMITCALKNRIGRLQAKHVTDSQVSAKALVKGFMTEELAKKRHYVRGLRNLVKLFNSFIEEHLGAMLAAEELGGPVVGDLLHIDDEVLKAGFNCQGKPKKQVTGIDATISRQDRKNRIDEIWGASSDVDEQRTEKDAAGAAFRSLSEELLNASAGDADDSSSPDGYVQITQDSAAARFLVRAKVAQFHPNDARKLRLVDFTKE